MIPVQIISILFAMAMAWHNAPAVSQFEHSGINNLWMARFHRYGWWTKLLFVAACYLAAGILPAAAGGLWIYLLFDPMLNRSRIPARPWDYLGLNDGDGRFWNGTFGRYAGKVKAAVILAAIIMINLIYYL